MIKIYATGFSFLLFGVLLASGIIDFSVRAGYIGGPLLVAIAWSAKHYWRRRRAIAGDDPGRSERNAWLYLAGTAMICGYVITVLMTPGSEFHRNSGDTGGLDSWLMLAGATIAYLILHESNTSCDERDVAIKAIGNRVGYASLIILLMIFLLMLAFAPRDLMQRFTHWLIANTLITVIMLATLAQYVAQLTCYQHDAKLLDQPHD